MRVGVVQLTSTDDVAANLTAAQAGVRRAVREGAEWVALPEMFAFLRREGREVTCAQGLDGEIVSAARSWAREHSISLLAGSFPEAVAGEDRVHNTSVWIGPEGEIGAVYRKIHLFDVDLGEAGGGVYRESTRIAPGEDLALAKTPAGGVGLSICYDLRFPELYRELVRQGARFLMVPSAFAPETGRAHWEVLLRARAIENQAFVVAPAQCGRHAEDRASHGHSLLIDPWGRILTGLGVEPGVAVADCDLAAQERVREQLPALRHRRL